MSKQLEIKKKVESEIDDLRRFYASQTGAPPVQEPKTEDEGPRYRKSGPPVAPERARKFAANIVNILANGVDPSSKGKFPIGRKAPELDANGAPTRAAELGRRPVPRFLSDSKK